MAICSCLDIQSIIALTRTCKSLTWLYKELVPLLWDANRSLKRYVKNPKGLRSQLALADALISGSFVIQFLDRVEYPDADLDIFVGSHLGESLIEYLVKEEGYEPKNPVEEDPTYVSTASFQV